MLAKIVVYLLEIDFNKTLQVLVDNQLIGVERHLVHIVTVRALQVALAVLGRDNAAKACARAAFEQTRIVDHVKWHGHFAHNQVKYARVAAAAIGHTSVGAILECRRDIIVVIGVVVLRDRS